MITELVNKDLILLNLRANTKDEVMKELVHTLHKDGRINSEEEFLYDIKAREATGNTGFDDGIAIPHAKSKAVIKPAVAIGIKPSGIDWGAEDGELSKIFFMIASPDNGANHHIEVLTELSTKIIEDGFLDKLMAATTTGEALELLVGKQEAKVVPQPTPEPAKPVAPKVSWKERLNKAKQHLLFGTSHMLPFVVAGGVLLALAVMATGKGAVPDTGVLADISTIAIKGLVLFPIILGGFIGYSIADKPALAPAFIASGIMADAGGGFLGCIVAGFVAGYTVLQLKRIPIPSHLSALGVYFLYPLAGTLISAGIVMWGLGAAISSFMLGMNELLASLAGSSKAVLGAILGGMTAFDMGGPINKVATLFAQTQVDTQPWLMGGVGIAICTPPLGMALATFLFKKKFSKEEQEAGKAAAIMGSIGISEGAIPFAANDPMRVLPSIVIGGMVGCIFGFTTDVLLHAPWGGLITAPVSSNIPMYVAGILAGSVTTAIIVGFWKPVVVEGDSVVTDAPVITAPVAGEGEYDVLAVTCCPSGVAHTFMAAKALEKAGALHNVKIKVETQGSNGIQNRLTAKDVANAKYIIFANDVAIKEADRFTTLKSVSVSTKDAMRNASNLVQG